jgi:hypothetical protein
VWPRIFDSDESMDTDYEILASRFILLIYLIAASILTASMEDSPRTRVTVHEVFLLPAAL